LGQNELVENKLYLLKIDIRPMRWIEVSAKGIAPSYLFLRFLNKIEKRYGHTMTFNDKLGILTIFGGTDDL